MDELEKLNLTLKTEANEILHDYGLLRILNKYGNPIITGSHALNLMTWRDLDIYLEANKISEDRFFELGKEILLSLKPERMHFRNEFIMKSIDLPVGLYWGVYTTLKFSGVWKIDIWAMSSDQTILYLKKFNDLKSKFNINNRNTILRIKNHFFKHPEYRKKFSSMDIYHAVIEEDIKSIKEFSEWLGKNKGIPCDFT